MKYDINWLIDQFEKNENIELIVFYEPLNNNDFSSKYSFFSQSVITPFWINNVLYQSVAHWMVASKATLFDDIKSYESIIACGSNEYLAELEWKIIGFDEVCGTRRNIKCSN